MLTDVYSRIALKSDLAILAEHRISCELHYQPIVDIRTGRITGGRDAGTLAAPDAGPSLPRFVHPVRRGDGSHHGHRRRRARSSVRASRAMGQAGHRCPSVSVNLSARQLHEPDLVATVKRALEGAG